METDDNSLSIGERLFRLRKMAGLTRAELAKQAKVGQTSIVYWEKSVTSSIKTNNVEKLIAALRRSGIDCNEQWLMSGRGPQPKFEEDKSKIIPPNIKFDIEEHGNDFSILQQEALNFRASNSSAVTITVNHNSMLPVCGKGDIVGGIWTSSHFLQTTEPCIIEINGKLDLRCVTATVEPNIFNLHYLSYEKSRLEPFSILNLSLERIARIIRIWRL